MKTKRWEWISLALLTAFPLVASGIAIWLLLPDIVPLHIGPNGLDRIGSKYEALPPAGMLFGCEVLCALSYIFMDKLDALGLVNGTDAHGARRIMLPTMVVFDIIVVAGIIWMAGGV